MPTALNDALRFCERRSKVSRAALIDGAIAYVAETMQDPTVDVAYGNTYWIDQRGELIAEQRQTPFMSMGYLYGGSTLQQQSTFWKSDLYRKCGGMDASFGFAFDTDLFFRFIASGARLA